MGRIGRVLKTEIEKFILQTVEARYGLNQLCKQYAPSGEDSPPVKNDRVLLVKIDGTGQYAACGVLSISQGAKPGEKIIYGRNENGEIQAVFKLLQDGSVSLDAPGDIAYKSQKKIKLNDGSNGAARKGDQVKVQIPAGAVIVSVSGGSGAPAVGVPNGAPIDCVGTIQAGSGSVLVGD